MHTNVGLYKENEMILAFNGKCFEQLSNNCKDFIREMFGPVDRDALIICNRLNDYIKPDFKIQVKDSVHYVSMKSGRSNALHQEDIDKFCNYLRQNGICEHTIETILLYQYGDGTLDGSGQTRMDYNNLRLELSERIKLANEDLNKDKTFLLNIMSRVIFKGTKAENIEADYIYHGDVNYGVLVSKTQLFKHLVRKNWKWMTNLHIGPLQIRPHARYIEKEIINEKSRQKLEVYWANYFEDLAYISKRYDG